MSKPRLLLIDDEDALLRALRRVLTATHQVTIAQGADAALELLAAGQRFDAILCDLAMPGLSGLDLYRMLCDRYPALAGRFLLLTGGIRRDLELPPELSQRVIYKPAETGDLLRLLSRTTGSPT